METTRAAFSLRWKILAWFFVNLLVLGVILFVFGRVQFGLGIDSLLAGPTSDRLEGIAAPLANELRTQPVAQWNASLERATAVWRARGLSVGLFRGDGSYFAGDIRTLPTEVTDVIQQHERRNHGGFISPPNLRGRPPGEHRDPNDEPRRPPPDDDDGVGGGPPSDPGTTMDAPDGEGSFGERRRRRGDRPAIARDLTPSAIGLLDKFMLVAGDPRQYWAGVHLGEVHPPSSHGPPISVTLLFASESLRGGGLFFDYAPWLALGGGLVLVSVLMWLPFVHGLTRSLARMTRTAEDIARGNFDPPPPSFRRDELGRLGRALGDMAQRLDGFVTGQKRFLGDTAHELLSPLARLEVALSILEQRAGPGGDHRYTARALDEVRHMATLVGDLLSFTKANLDTQPAPRTPLDLAALVEQVMAREVAQDAVSVSIAEGLRVCAEPELLARALGNAVRNAVRYAGQDGPITILAVPVGDAQVMLTISDHGPGVPPGAIDRLFDPFFRPEAARTRETGGTGLGLAIVKSCVEACGGQVAVRNRDPRGLELTFTLPRAD